MAGESFAGMAGRPLWGWRGGSAGMAGESFVGMGESMVAVLVLHDNTASFPRRRESTGRYCCSRAGSELYRSFHFISFVGWAIRSVPIRHSCEAGIHSRWAKRSVCHSRSTCLNCQAAKSDVPTYGFSGCWSRLCRAVPLALLPMM